MVAAAWSAPAPHRRNDNRGVLLPAPRAPNYAASMDVAGKMTPRQMLHLIGGDAAGEESRLPAYLLDRSCAGPPGEDKDGLVAARRRRVAKAIADAALSRVLYEPDAARVDAVDQGEEEDADPYLQAIATSYGGEDDAEERLRLLSLVRYANGHCDGKATRGRFSDLAGTSVSTHAWAAAARHACMHGPGARDLRSRVAPTTVRGGRLTFEAAVHFIHENLTTTSPHGSKLVKSSDGTLVTELASVQRLYTPEECARRYAASFGDEQPPMGRSAFLDVLSAVTHGQHCALGALDSTAEHFGRDAFRDAATSSRWSASTPSRRGRRTTPPASCSRSSSASAASRTRSRARRRRSSSRRPRTRGRSRRGRACSPRSPS